MGDFAVRFLLCNLFICIIAGLLLAAKGLLRKSLTSRMQYLLWFPFLGLLAVPFLPLRPPMLLSWLKGSRHAWVSPITAIAEGTFGLSSAEALGWMEDFGTTIGQRAPSGTGLLLFAIWVAGMAGMAALTLHSAIRFHAFKKSALPLQNPGLYRLYEDCLEEMGIAKPLPIYSTAYLQSPVIAGLLKPCIYLPLHLISDCHAKDIRYMLLHELSHYRHRDYAVNSFMNIARVLYWFNPTVWYVLKEMKTDREIACDASVLKLLRADAYQEYGATLINLAEKISCSTSPFAMGINGSMRQMKKRILHIVAYEKASRKKVVSGSFVCVCITALLLAFLPFLSTGAADPSRYVFQEQGKTVVSLDLEKAFGKNEGSFVLYDARSDTWQIYNEELATARVAPVSTYKIYSALLGLETGIISPEHSLLAWDGRQYGFAPWNCDQTLSSAMANSVNWYFQEIDRQAGLPAVRDYVEEIGYGSRTVGGDIATYWTDSSLAISPIEQVEMLQKFYNNQFGFSPENVKAVKDSIYLYTEEGSAVYGKTGTGNVDGKNSLGWFIGYIEEDGRTCFFATEICKGEPASGSAAAELTISILSELDILD